MEGEMNLSVQLDGGLSLSNDFQGDLGGTYKGSTFVTPNFETQTLGTAGKILTSNVTVNPIPYEEYDGATTVTPNFATQTLPTEGKILNSDVKVNPIPNEVYYGDTTVTPNFDTQTLETEGKIMNFDVTVNPIPYEIYDGETTVTPSTQAQTLQTAGKIVEDNITVEAVPLYSGVTIITPTKQEQKFLTMDKLVAEDLTVNPIPDNYYDMSVPYFFLGLNPEYLGQIHSERTALSDTSYPSWTASTTAKAIKSGSSIDDIDIDLEQYEYWIRWRVDFKAVYESNIVRQNVPIRQVLSLWQNIHKHPSTKPNMESMTDNAKYCIAPYYNALANYLYYYGNTVNNTTYAWGQQQGFYASPVAGSFTGDTIYTPTTPTLYARCNATYFATARKTQVSTDSAFVVKGDLFRVKAQSSMPRFVYRDCAEIFNNPLTV